MRALLLAAAGIGLAIAPAASARADVLLPGDNMIGYTGQIVAYTVQTSGLYDITATGANGGGVDERYVHPAGGLGFALTGTFMLTAGETIDVLVGGGGVTGNEAGAGGGGGTYVVENSTTPLLVAGGGGAGGVEDPGGNATGVNPAGTGAGGTGGQAYGPGGGGGGFYGNGGTTSLHSFPGGGGASFVNGGVGGAIGYVASGAGGFGGGGGGGVAGGGGGGGYDGGSGADGLGAGTSAGGGGDSFLAASVIDANLTLGYNTGGDSANGSLDIDFLPSVAVPEPVSAAVFGVGLLGLGLIRRRVRTPAA